MQTHVKIVAVLFLVFGGLCLMLALFFPLIMGALAAIIGRSGDHDAAVGATVLGVTGVIAAVIFVVFSIPAIVCGIGLLKRASWSRIMGIILAAIALLKFPFGTLFGVYALWVLFNKETEALLASSGGVVAH